MTVLRTTMVVSVCAVLVIAGFGPVTAASGGDAAEPAARETVQTDESLQDVAREAAEDSIAWLETENVPMSEENKRAAIRAATDAGEAFQREATGPQRERIESYQVYAAVRGATTGALAGSAHADSPGVDSPAATYEIAYGSAVGSTQASHLARIYGESRPGPPVFVTWEHTYSAAVGAAAGATTAARTHPELTSDGAGYASSEYLRQATRGGASGAIGGTQGSSLHPDFGGLMMDPTSTLLTAEGATRGALDGAVRRVREDRPAASHELYAGANGAASSALLSAVTAGHTDEQQHQNAYQGALESVYSGSNGQQASRIEPLRTVISTNAMGPVTSVVRSVDERQGPERRVDDVLAAEFPTDVREEATRHRADGEQVDSLEGAARQGVEEGFSHLEGDGVSASEPHREAVLDAAVDGARALGERDDDVDPADVRRSAFGATVGALSSAKRDSPAAVPDAQPTVIDPDATYEIVFGAMYGASAAAVRTKSAPGSVPPDAVIAAASGAATGSTLAVLDDPDAAALSRAAAAGAAFGALDGARAIGTTVTDTRGVATSLDPQPYVSPSAQGAARGTLAGVADRRRADRPTSETEAVRAASGAAANAVVVATRNNWRPDQAYYAAYETGVQIGDRPAGTER